MTQNTISLSKTIFLLALLLTFSTGCILPPRGVKTETHKSLEDIAEHNIKINQVGYFPQMSKIAVLKADEKKPVKWELLNSKNKTVFKGETTYFGKDTDSGNSVHIIDFSSFSEKGQGYYLKAQNAKSALFDIHADLYRGLRRDSLRYFYYNRSGMPLEMPFVEDKKAARKAGHLCDKTARCEPTERCKYKKDVSGGWYDAGDYGKYVVNAGISVWLILNIYEHLYIRSDARKEPVNMNIPESDNGVPDILDEVRFELEWMLKMQVDEGPEEGLVHHRVRSSQYTKMGAPPPEYNREEPHRYLWDTTTASTLNLAASGALCARVFKDIDEKFANKCLEAAQKAWNGAVQNPDLMPVSTGYIPYNDNRLEDDFFWAAAELFATTREEKYLNWIKKSPVLNNPNQNAGKGVSLFNWADTDGMGTIALAMALPDEFEELKQTQQQILLSFADKLLDLTHEQGYRYPHERQNYQWGSNSFVLNNAVILALAYDLTNEKKYMDAVVWAMDYILGRNPLDFSYVSGYGTISMTYPHHRFFAPTYDDKLPYIHPGAIAGGPNRNMQDPVMVRHRTGCAPAKCYIDDIGSYSANEVAINWNAALVWVTAWLDERAR